VSRLSDLALALLAATSAALLIRLFTTPIL
jgi:hypothetical protein